MDGCNTNPIVGVRYKCNKCPDFDFCQNCYDQGQHDKTHDFITLNIPSRYCGRRNKWNSAYPSKLCSIPEAPVVTTTAAATTLIPLATTTTTATNTQEKHVEIPKTIPETSKYESPKVEPPVIISVHSTAATSTVGPDIKKEEPKRAIPKLEPIKIDSPKVEPAAIVKKDTKVEYPQVVTPVVITTTTATTSPANSNTTSPANTSPKKIIQIEDSPKVEVKTVNPTKKGENEINWSEKLKNLADMGFTDVKTNIRLLRNFNGNLELTINELISNAN